MDDQYELLPSSSIADLRKLLRVRKPQSIFIRKRGSLGGGVLVNKSLRRAKLSVKHQGNILIISISGVEVFRYKLDALTDGKIFTLAYIRLDARGQRPMFVGQLPDPDAPGLPHVAWSVLRSCNMDCLLEIEFTGKIKIRKTRRLMLPGFPYWRMVI